MDERRLFDLVEVAYALHQTVGELRVRKNRPQVVREETFQTRNAAEARRNYLKRTLSKARQHQLPLARWLNYTYAIRERPYANDVVLEWKKCVARTKGPRE